MGVLLQAVCRHQREQDGVVRPALLPEDLPLVAQLRLVLPVDGEQLVGVLHLAQVRHPVRTLYDEVDLGARVALGAHPREALGMHGGYAYGMLQLPDVAEACDLERVAPPGVIGLRSRERLPARLIASLYEAEAEEKKRVD